MTRRVYGTAGGTRRVLACIRVLRGSLGAPGDEAIGADQQRAVHLEVMRGGRHFSTSQLHTEAIYTSGTPTRCITRSATEIHAASLAPASSMKRRPYRSMVEISRPLKVTATCGARVPGSPAIAPWGERRRDVLRRAEYGRRAVPVAHCHRPIVDERGTSAP
jgi:hypothetical protein